METNLQGVLNMAFYTAKNILQYRKVITVKGFDTLEAYLTHVGYVGDTFTVGDVLVLIGTIRGQIAYIKNEDTTGTIKDFTIIGSDIWADGQDGIKMDTQTGLIGANLKQGDLTIENGEISIVNRKIDTLQFTMPSMLSEIKIPNFIGDEAFLIEIWGNFLKKLPLITKEEYATPIWKFNYKTDLTCKLGDIEFNIDCKFLIKINNKYYGINGEINEDVIVDTDKFIENNGFTSTDFIAPNVAWQGDLVVIANKSYAPMITIISPTKTQKMDNLLTIGVENDVLYIFNDNEFDKMTLEIKKYN